MALTAARSDLAISLVGDDQVTAMLDNAKNQMAGLEGKLKDLKSAGDAQAASAKAQTSALGNTNRALVGMSKSAEGLVEGLDKTKGAFQKVVGALGFWGAAISGAIAIGSELIDLFSSTNSELDKMQAELEASRKTANEFKTSMDQLATSIGSVAIASATLEGTTSGLRGRLAALRGDAIGVEFERRLQEQLKTTQEIAETETKIGETRAAQAKASKELPKIARELEEGLAREQRLRAEIAKEQMDARLGTQTVEKEITAMKSLQLQQQMEDNKFNREVLAGTQRRSKELEGQVDSLFEQKALLQEIAEELPKQEFKPPKTQDPKPRGGAGGSRVREPDLEAAAQREIDLIMQELEAAQLEVEFEADVRAAEERTLERQKKRAEEAKRAADEARKAAAEAAMVQRESDTEGIYSFIGALGQLVPELGAVEQAMQRVTAAFDLFRDGQMSFAEAVATSATEVAASVARSVGGVKAEAAVRSAYHLAMGFGTLATPFISAGHFTAAAMLAGVATGVIKTGGGGGASAPSGGMGRPAQASASSGGSGAGGGNTTVNNYTLRAGVVDGQSTTRAFRRAEMASRNTGFAHAGGW